MTLGLFDSITATQELVVPKSIPMVLKKMGLDLYSRAWIRRIQLISQLGEESYLRCEATGALRGHGGALSDKVSLSFEKCSQHLLCVTALKSKLIM